MTYNELYLLVYGDNQSVDIYYTDVHPDNDPRCMEYEVAHNLDLDLYVKITPASGSHYEIIDKISAAQLLNCDGLCTIPKVAATIRPDYTVWYDRTTRKESRTEKTATGGVKRFEDGKLVYHGEGKEIIYSIYHGIGTNEKDNTGKSS
jgi:hypothetical protein